MLGKCLWTRGRPILFFIILVAVFGSWIFAGVNDHRDVRRAELSVQQRQILQTRAVNNTVTFVPVNDGMLHLAQNLLCSLRRTSFNTSSLVFWTLDDRADAILTRQGFATLRDRTLYSVGTNENLKGFSRKYKRMMKERPKFFIKILSAGYDILMLDADTVFWQSPALMIADREENVDAVFSTDAREFYQTHNAFRDAWRRGRNMPPICNGIFWMRSSKETVALWSDMLAIFNARPPWGWWLRFRSSDDQQSMDVLLNDGRAQLVGPLPDGIRHDMIPQASTTAPTLKVRLLDQTMVVNGHLLMNRPRTYEQNIARLQTQGQERIAAHFNWGTRQISKEAGAKAKGMYFLDHMGNCVNASAA